MGIKQRRTSKKRRTFDFKGLFFLLISFIFVFAGCKKEISPVTRSVFSMGTFVEITAYDGDTKKAVAAINETLDKINELSDKLTIFNQSSEISKVNREAAKKPVKVSEEVFEVLKESLRFSRLSDGAFDITVGPLMDLWGFNRKKGRVPTSAEINATLQKVGWEKIILNESDRTVSFKKEGMKIDLGGIAKGYAAGLAAKILRRNGITSALVNAGGNLYALGAPPGKNFWLVGIKHPRQNRLLGKIQLKNMACATSGDYENFFIINGHRYGHIINPRTGFPVEGVISVTILSPAAVDTDGLSTAVFVMGKEKGAALIEKLPGTFGLIIYEDKNILSKKVNYYLTTGAERYFLIS